MQSTTKSKNRYERNADGDYPPVVYRVYEFYAQYIGKENAVTDEVVIASKDIKDFRLSERTLREIKRAIALDSEFDNVYLSCTKGTYMATKDDLQYIAQNAVKAGLSLLEKAWAQQKKAGMDGQFMLQLTPFQREAVQSLGEVRE